MESQNLQQADGYRLTINLCSADYFTATDD